MYPLRVLDRSSEKQIGKYNFFSSINFVFIHWDIKCSSIILAKRMLADILWTPNVKQILGILDISSQTWIEIAIDVYVILNDLSVLNITEAILFNKMLICLKNKTKQGCFTFNLSLSYFERTVFLTMFMCHKTLDRIEPNSKGSNVCGWKMKISTVKGR